MAVLELLVETGWVVETLKALGGGHMAYLSFAVEQVEPTTLCDLRAGKLAPGATGEILAIGTVLKPIALFELVKFNDQPGFIRLDFRLLSVVPFMRGSNQMDGHEYRCRYRTEP